MPPAARAVPDVGSRPPGRAVIQFSSGGSLFYAGKGLDNTGQMGAVAGAVAGAYHVRALAKAYGVPVILHTDHCAKTLLPWVDGLLEASEEYHALHGEPLFSSHMLDLSEEPHDENIACCAEYLKQMAPLNLILEMEIGVTPSHPRPSHPRPSHPRILASSPSHPHPHPHPHPHAHHNPTPTLKSGRRRPGPAQGQGRQAQVDCREVPLARCGHPFEMRRARRVLFGLYRALTRVLALSPKMGCTPEADPATCFFLALAVRYFPWRRVGAVSDVSPIAAVRTDIGLTSD